MHYPYDLSSVPSYSKNRIYKLSKFLIWILRHGALELGIPMRADGYVAVDDLLSYPAFAKYQYTYKDVMAVLEIDWSNIYTICIDERYDEKKAATMKKMYIKANFEHSIPLTHLQLDTVYPVFSTISPMP